MLLLSSAVLIAVLLASCLFAVLLMNVPMFAVVWGLLTSLIAICLFALLVRKYYAQPIKNTLTCLKSLEERRYDDLKTPPDASGNYVRINHEHSWTAEKGACLGHWSLAGHTYGLSSGGYERASHKHKSGNA